MQTAPIDRGFSDSQIAVRSTCIPMMQKNTGTNTLPPLRIAKIVYSFRTVAESASPIEKRTNDHRQPEIDFSDAGSYEPRE